MFEDIANYFSQDTKEYLQVGQPGAVEKFYSLIEAEGYNLEEMKDILECDDSMLVVSCAGSGKTTTLIFKLLRDFLSGKFSKKIFVNGVESDTTCEILVSTFLKSGATELKTKFQEWVNKLNIKGIDVSKIHFRTIHSEVYQTLKFMNYPINIVNEGETYRYIKQACKQYNIKAVMSKSKELTNEEISDIACILTYSRNRLDSSKYYHPLMNEYGMTEIELKAILEEFKLLKKVANIQDFEDLEEALYEGIVMYPNVKNYLMTKYDYIYLDEFQDTSQLQYAILEPYLKGAKGFMAVGDDDQCIYSWRGSDSSLIQHRLEEDYKLVVKQLSVNRRCRENILKPVIPSIELNLERHKKDLRAANKGGEVNIIVDGGASFLMKAVHDDLMKSENVGILGRTNADLLIPALLLELGGYSSFSLSKSVSLSDRIPSQVLGVMDLITQRYNEKFEGYFKLFLNKHNSYEASKLCETLSTMPQYSIYTLDIEDIEYSAPTLFSIIRMLRNEMPKNAVNAYLKLLDIMEEDVYNGKTIYAQRARDFVYYIKKIIKEHEKVKGLSIQELDYLFHVRLAESLEKKKVKNSRRVQRRDGTWETEAAVEDNAFVKITTVHDAKGKQWDNVYIWNDVDGCFPNSVGNRGLTKEEYEEERRVHYIAWTRAVKKLTVFTRSDRLEGFLSECDVSGANIIDAKETKKLTVDNRTKSAKEMLEMKSRVKKDNEVEVKDWKWYLTEYCKKYTSYNYICTSKGSNLDMCLVKYESLEGLTNKLSEYELEKYPIDELEDVISDILESLVD